MSTRRRTRLAPVTIAAAAAVFATTAVPSMAAIPPPTGTDDLAAIVDAMTVDQLIGQMTWTHVYGNSADDMSMATTNQTRYGVNTPAEVVEKYDLGGVLYFAWSNTVIAGNPVGTAELSNGLQAAAIGDDGPGIPLAVTIDQEGGIVARMGAPMTVLPGNMALGATFDAALAHQQGVVLGSELAAVGVNVDFAPVVDLNTNPANPVIGVRSMGEDPDTVSALGVGQIEGMQSEGVAAAAKHFPGHGDTSVDSHTGLPIVTYDRATLDEHIEPFRAAIAAGVDMIMTAHIIVEAIDPEMPGTLSPLVLTGLLREELGFDGLITTDALDMSALKELPDRPLDDAEIAVLAVQAGSDILLNSPNVDAQFAGIHAALEAGELTRERLEESVMRILQWKLDRGVWTDDPSVDPAAVDGIVGSAENLAVATEIAERAATLLRNTGDVLPLNENDAVLMVGAGNAWPERMGPMLTARGFEVTELYENGTTPSAAYRDSAVAAADSHDVIVFASINASGASASAVAQQQMVAALADTGVPVVVVAARNPYDINAYPTAAAVINIYGWGVPNFQGAVAVVAGDVNPSGRLPVDVPAATGGEVLLELGFGLRYGEEVVPEPVTFVDEPGTADDSYTVPAVEGVVYKVGDVVVEAGTHPGAGTVTVTAEPVGYNRFPEGATTTWSVTFDAASPSPEPPAPPVVRDLYSTPGFHHVNGRWWYTDCEPYSQTIRCTTQIWATQVRAVGGSFVGTTDWHFNNLTYLPFMTRAAWGANPLANEGEWVSDEGRRWRTECDSAASGRGGCRSWIWSSHVVASQNSAGVWSYAMDQGWVMNNLVRFSA